MKKILLALLFLSLPAYAQFTHKQQTGTIAASTTCPGNGCVTINAGGAVTAFVTLSAITGGTYGFFCSNDSWGTTKAVLAYAYTAATGVVATSSVITATANGDWVLTLPACQYFGVVATIQGATATVRIDLDSVKFAGSGGSTGAASGDLSGNYPNPTVVATHLTTPLPVEQGGGGTTTGVSWKTPNTATFICGGTTWTWTGLTPQTPTGAGSASVPASSGPGGAGGRCYVKYTSGAVSGNIGGIVYSGGIDARTDFQPRSVFTIFTDSAVTSRRIWVGHNGGTLSTGGGHVPPTGSVAFASGYVGVGYDPAVNGGKWVVATGDATNESGTDSGVAVSANTYYVIDIDMSLAPTSVSVGINGTYITKATNIPGNAINLGTELFTVTNAASAAALHLAEYTVYR